MRVIVFFFSLIIFQTTTMTVFNFNTKSDVTSWRIVDDVVMGGRSNGDFLINDDGNGMFHGKVSLENNGGFSMVQYPFETVNVSEFSKVKIRLKGDGKTYQFRVKSSNSDYYSYITPFQTNGEWQTIEVNFNSMYPAFRGRALNIGNYKGKQLEMVAFLIGNKKAESFKLEIDSIVLN